MIACLIGTSHFQYLKERYPKTDISGDGQVVVIEFNHYTVELVPGFKQPDNRFKYPDTHDGGAGSILIHSQNRKPAKNVMITQTGFILTSVTLFENGEMSRASNLVDC